VSITCVFGSTVTKIDYEWIDYLKLILVESEVIYVSMCLCKSELNDNFECKISFTREESNMSKIESISLESILAHPKVKGNIHYMCLCQTTYTCQTSLHLRDTRHFLDLKCAWYIATKSKQCHFFIHMIFVISL
jgi:hypothetical protein